MELKMKFASLTAAAMVACALVATPVLANDVTARDGANTGDTVTLHFPFNDLVLGRYRCVSGLHGWRDGTI